jgi:hypothetical protein
LPFAAAHTVAAHLAAARDAARDRPLSELLTEVSGEVLGQSIHYRMPSWRRSRPAHFVGTRHKRGPAPAETGRALAASRDTLQRDERQAAGFGTRSRPPNRGLWRVARYEAGASWSVDRGSRRAVRLPAVLQLSWFSRP